jgi:hypothetical protein
MLVTADRRQAKTNKHQGEREGRERLVRVVRDTNNLLIWQVATRRGQPDSCGVVGPCDSGDTFACSRRRGAVLIACGHDLFFVEPKKLLARAESSILNQAVGILDPDSMHW